MLRSGITARLAPRPIQPMIRPVKKSWTVSAIRLTARSTRAKKATREAESVNAARVIRACSK